MLAKRKTNTPSYRLHKSSGQAITTLSGRDYYLGPYGSEASRAKYDRLVAKWLAGNRRPLPPGQDDNAAVSELTIVELVARYWAYAEEYYRGDHKELSKIRVAVGPLVDLFGKLDAASFGPVALKAVRAEMIGQRLARKYVNAQVRRIRFMFSWAVEEELVPGSIMHALREVKGLRRGKTDARETEPVKPVPDENVDTICQHVSRQVWAMIQLQRLTGMRSGEVIIMRACDLDMTGTLWLYRPASHKTQCHGHERVVEIGPRAQEAIRPFLKTDLEAFLFSPADAVAEQKTEKRRRRKTRVQPSQCDRSKRDPKRVPKDHYTPDSYRRVIARACQVTESPHWHPHQLRHNYATRVRREYGIETARILLGHRSVAVTEVYAEIDRAKAREIVAKIG